MIGKVIRGKSFSGLCNYILNNEQAKLIDTNMVEGDASVLALQLKATWDLNYRVRYPTAHFSLSFAPGEKPSHSIVKEISQKLLLGMGFNDHLYFVAEHNDCDHYHLHIGASRISCTGKRVDDWYERKNCEDIVRKLEVEYDLVRVTNSSEVALKAPSTGQVRRMRREEEEYKQGLRELPPEPSTLEKLQNTIANSITPKISLSNFLDKLTEEGVETKIRISNEGEIQGISYAMGKVAFAGRKLGRNELSCTLKGLEERGVNIGLLDLPKIVEHSNLKGLIKLDLIIDHPKNEKLLFGKESVQKRDLELIS